MTVESPSLLQQRLSALHAEMLWLDDCMPLDVIEHAKQLSASLLYWRAKCAEFPGEIAAKVEDVIAQSFIDDVVIPWEHFSILLSFPGLASRRRETAVEIVQSLRLNTAELLAVANVFAKLGLLQSSMQCFNSAIERNEISAEHLLDAASWLLVDANTSYLFHAESDAAQGFIHLSSWLEAMARGLRGMSEGQSQPIHFENFKLSRSEQFASFDLQDTIRCLHHVACSGGTVICKCLAVMPRVCLLSEVNPFNRYGIDFNPSNPILLYERTQGKAPLAAIKESFVQDIDKVFRLAKNNNSVLVLRDHAHTDFFSGLRHIKGEPVGLYSCLEDDYTLISAVTVRHPLDSYLSLVSLGWDVQFQPNTFDAYCNRYLDFLACYGSKPIHKYEDFCADPDQFLQKLCADLFIQYDPGYRDHFGSIELSGDSGRGSNTEIKIRERRLVSDSLKRELASSSAYHELCSRLGYEVD